MKKIITDLPTYMDYPWLSHKLAHYASPRVKIHAMLKGGDIVRVRKGLYIPGKAYNRDYSRGVLANLVFGPSYVSFEYALAWYGLIPERVRTVTSACAKRRKKFATPLGTFEYLPIPRRVFHEGVGMVSEAGASFLMASPEKALADWLARSRGIDSTVDLEESLYDSMRMERDALLGLDSEKLRGIARLYHKKPVTLASEYLSVGKNHE